MDKPRAWQAAFAVQAHEAYDRLWNERFARYGNVVPEERGIVKTRELAIRAQIRADYASNPDMQPVKRERRTRLRKRKPPTIHSTPTVASRDCCWWNEDTQPDPHGTQPIPLAELLR